MEETECEVSEYDRVSDYRLGVMVGLGLPWEDAEELSITHSIRLEEVRRLIARGCPEKLVGRILL